MRSHDATVVVWDTRRDAVLVAEGGGLPRLSFETTWPPLDHRLCAAVERTLGIRTVVLEVLDFVTIVLEVVGPATTPPGFGWRDRETMRSLGGWYARWVARKVDRRAPWFVPGWYGRALDTVADQISRYGGEITGPAVQLKHWSLSSVLRVPTTIGNVYLKTALPGLVHEPDIIAVLAREWPRAVPEVLAESPAGHWWLATDFGGVEGWTLPPHVRAEVLPVLTAMQRSFIGRTAKLTRVGCPTRTASTLADELSRLFAREQLWTAPPQLRNLHRTLQPTEYERLVALVPLLRDACEQLSAGPVSDTLTHGDFVESNTARRRDGFVIYDWGFASVAHPFLDLATWLYDADEQTALAHVDTYLSGWRDVVAPDDAAQCWRVARLVGAAVEAWKFATLADMVGPDYDFNWLPMMYGWARRLLHAVGAGASSVGFGR